ncbi:hypothetical protein NPIL_3631 [Nephila pilipes]|uniref:Uncharacterized protein n=1 Tax=Nephila pilipes TaxID=299642 RepID=A0A8X6QCC3_NEPPI|nr:hypothetical protein NPIL_3631 [Nephila pilipes]
MPKKELCDQPTEEKGEFSLFLLFRIQASSFSAPPGGERQRKGDLPIVSPFSLDMRRLVRSSAKGCRPAQCRLRSQPRKNPSLATVRGERKFVRHHKKELSRRAGVWTVVCGQGCMTRPNDALRSRFPDLFELSSTGRDSEEAEQEG